MAPTFARPALGRPRWTLRTVDEARARRLATGLGIHPAVARVLAGRGLEDEESCRAFFAPRLASLRDPFELHDMDRAVERTLSALRNGEKIGVFGDYDVDGVSSTALMVLTLRFLGTEPVTFIP
ncbi:single-stranded-DNA-specific exonuclease RecJ, partial [Candidatus Poribacteria bacterium]|nr:single-stranded-DNA-specific exonuclease RecJ [Candidatus Poribacteria bacterium]